MRNIGVDELTVAVSADWIKAQYTQMNTAYYVVVPE